MLSTIPATSLDTNLSLVWLENEGQGHDTDDYGNAFAHIISDNLSTFLSKLRLLAYRLTLPVNALRSRTVSSSVSIADDIRVTLNGLIVGVRPLWQLDVNFTTFGFPHAFDVDYIGMNWVAPFVQLLDKFRYPSIMLVFYNFRRFSSLITIVILSPALRNAVSQSSVKDVVIKLGNSNENVQIGFECNRCPRRYATSNFRSRILWLATNVVLLIHFTITLDGHLEQDGIDSRYAYAMQST